MKLSFKSNLQESQFLFSLFFPVVSISFYNYVFFCPFFSLNIMLSVFPVLFAYLINQLINLYFSTSSVHFSPRTNVLLHYKRAGKNVILGKREKKRIEKNIRKCNSRKKKIYILKWIIYF